MIDIPEFRAGHLDPSRFDGNIGAAFQAFVAELLVAEGVDAHAFPAGGKDGGIDLVGKLEGGGLRVYECKVTGEDDVLKAALQRWRKTADNLTRNLASPDGPPTGQSQYRPWYDSEHRVRDYVFCLSGTLANEEQRRTLYRSIKETFEKLARSHTHLAHLHDVTIELCDWEDVRARLSRQEHLSFRWFSKLRPRGLVDLIPQVRQGFQAYLYGDRLPYYSRKQHLEEYPAPAGVAVETEEDLLAILERNEAVGLIATSAGGLGKSRLAIEIAKLAEAQSWVVMRLAGGFHSEGLEQLRQQVRPDRQLLLLVDYVETLGEFAHFAETMTSYNRDLGYQFHFIASARTTYWSAISHLPGLWRIELAEDRDQARKTWLASYRRSAVAYVLAEAGLPTAPDDLTGVHDVPVFAAFMAYLAAKLPETQRAEISALLSFEDFERWVARRVRMTLGTSDHETALGNLAALLPLGEARVAHLSSQDREVHAALAQDGWIERHDLVEDSDGPVWRFLHDVLADRMLLNHLLSRRATLDLRLDEIIEAAERAGAIRSTLVSLQRIADDPLFNGMSWKHLLDFAIDKAPEVWRSARDLLARTPLLTPEQRLASFLELSEFWAGSETEPDYQLALGWLARWALKEGAGHFDETQKSSLVSLIEKAAPHVTVSNMPLTWGLRLNPSRLAHIALVWFDTRPTLPQTHYLLVAWLDSSLEPARVQEAVGRWLDARSEISQASFLIRAWLDAGGDKDLVAQPIRNWLGHHQTVPKAQFVYNAWLDAGGDKDLVAQPIRNWLEHHQTAPEARFVYNAWLDAGGDKGMVAQPVRNWLGHHQTAPEASHVYNAWLDAGGDKDLVEQPIRNWLGHHQTAPEASHVYKAWLDAGGDKDLVEQPIRNWLGHHQTAPEASHVYKAWLDAGGDKDLVEQPIRNWLSHHQTAPEASHVYKAWLDAGGDKDLVEQPIRHWLEHHQTAPEAQFVCKAWLDAHGDPPLVFDAACHWMASNWQRKEAVFLTKQLARSDTLPVASVKDILRWCCRFPDDEDTIWRLTSLFRHAGPRDLDLPFVAATAVVLGTSLAADGQPSPELGGQLRTLFVNIGGIGLVSAPLRSVCDRLQQLIFRDERTFATSADSPFVQNRFMVDLVLTLIHVGRVNLGHTADRMALCRFVGWLATWEDTNKAWARAVIEWGGNVVDDPDLRQELMAAVQPGTPDAKATPSAAA